MEKTEILALIDKAIKGQGTNVDAGGALATILEGIIELVEKIKEYSAGLGIGVSETGEISNLLVVDLSDYSDDDILPQELVEKLSVCCAIKIDGEYLGRLSAQEIAEYEEVGVAAAFGRISGSENAITSFVGWLIQANDNSLHYYAD